MNKKYNFDISQASWLKLNDIIELVFFIENKQDYFEYLSVSTRDFKVFWELSNTIVSPDITFFQDILIYKNTSFSQKNIKSVWEDRFLVSWGTLLQDICWFLMKQWYDSTHLLGIPWTVAGALVNNSWSGMLGKSLLDNLLEIEYYIREKYYVKSKKDILYSFRNTEFKSMNNLYIDTVTLSFERISEDELLEKKKKRFESRKKLRHIYQYPSLGTCYVSNIHGDYRDISSKFFSIRENKLINIGIDTKYEDYKDFQKEMNAKYELEIEMVNGIYDSDYVGVIFYDRQWNYLLQKRDIDAPSNPSMLTLFWGEREINEEIRDTALREIKEELGISVSQDALKYFGLFLKEHKRCFIFQKEIDDMFDFSRTIVCNEWKYCIKNISTLSDILEDQDMTPLFKKVLFYKL